MSESIYDLGAVDGPVAAAQREAEARQEVNQQPRGTARPQVRSGGGSVAGSASLFVPGSGLMMRGEWAGGLFFLVSLGLSGTLVWAILGSVDRIAGSLELLGLRPELTLWMLGATYVTAFCLYVGNVLAHSGEDRPALPPGVPALASLVLPGWGQVLNGHTGRAAIFLAGVWLTAAAWILDSGASAQMLEAFQVHLPRALGLLTTPAARWTLPAVLWTVAVYDALTAAANRRNSI